jgi:hypothetical protein
LALRSFTMWSATCSSYCMMCWMCVVLGFHNALRTVNRACARTYILYVKKIVLLVTAVCRLCITWDLKVAAEYEHLYHIPYTVPVSYLMMQYVIYERCKMCTGQSVRNNRRSKCYRAVVQNHYLNMDRWCWQLLDCVGWWLSTSHCALRAVM